MIYQLISKYFPTLISMKNHMKNHIFNSYVETSPEGFVSPQKWSDVPIGRWARSEGNARLLLCVEESGAPGPPSLGSSSLDRWTWRGVARNVPWSGVFPCSSSSWMVLKGKAWPIRIDDHQGYSWEYPQRSYFNR